jgi:predicted small secreted protein
MTKAYIKWAAFLASALLLTACTTEEEPESSAA